MAEQDHPQPNDGAHTPAPADDVLTYVPGGKVLQRSARTEKAANIIPRTELTPGDSPIVAVCPYCGTNLSKHAVGRYAQGPQGLQVEVFFPIQCHECNHPLLYMKTSGIIPARDLPRG